MHSVPVPGPLALLSQNQRQTPVVESFQNTKFCKVDRHRRPKTRLFQNVPDTSQER